jgi:hypothetical protein
MARKSPPKPYEVAKMTGTYTPSPLQRTTSTPNPLLTKSEHISSTANNNNNNNHNNNSHSSNEIVKINQNNNNNNTVYSNNTNFNSNGSSLISTKPELPPRDGSISSYRSFPRSSWDRPRSSTQKFTVVKSFFKYWNYRMRKQNISFSGWLSRYYDDDRYGGYGGYGGYYGSYGGYGRDYWRYQSFISTERDESSQLNHSFLQVSFLFLCDF